MMLSIELISVSIICLCHQAHMAQYQRKAMLDDFKPTHGSYYKGLSRSKVECSTRCESVTGLRSFFYVQNTHDCECYGTSYATSDGLSSVPSAKYYEKQGVCATSWVNIGTSCYFTPGPPTTMKYYDARDYCTTMGSYLLQLETPSESDAVKQYLLATYGAADWWIGLSDLYDEGTWVWRNSGITSTFYDWIIPPDGGLLGNFAIIENTVGWNDVDRIYPGVVPVCEKK